MVGSATRIVLVVASRTELAGSAAATVATGIDTALPTVTAQAADLTITISKGDDIEGRRLLWSYQSPHESVPGSTEPLVCTRLARRAAGRSVRRGLPRTPRSTS